RRCFVSPLQSAARSDLYPLSLHDALPIFELAPLADGAQVPRALAASFGVREVPGQPVLETVIRWLHARHALLILDNCEHLLAASAAAADALLRAVPGLIILATSREALNIA